MAAVYAPPTVSVRYVVRHDDEHRSMVDEIEKTIRPWKPSSNLPGKFILSQDASHPDIVVCNWLEAKLIMIPVFKQALGNKFSFKLILYREILVRRIMDS